MAKENKWLDLVIEDNCIVKPAVPGDFNTEVTEGKLWLHRHTYTMLRNGWVDLRSAALFLEQMRWNPYETASALKWKVDDVKTAYDKLRNQLDGFVDDRFLYPEKYPDPPQFSQGALHPLNEWEK